MSVTDKNKKTFSGLLFASGYHVITVFAVSIGFVPVLARWWWIADLAANLRVQMIIGLSIITAIVALGAGRRPVLLLLGALLFNMAAMLPAFQSDARALSTATQALPLRVRVCTNNVLVGNTQHQKVIESIREAKSDVFAIVELSSLLSDAIQRDLGAEYPHSVSGVNNDGSFGIGLWSKTPIKNKEVFYLCEPIVPSIEADVEVDGQLVRVIATHPIPPVRESYFAARNLHLSMLADRVRTFRSSNPDVPVILVGDLNVTPWSPWFDDFLKHSELRNGSSGKGLQPTWYRWKLFPFGLIIDHGLHSADIVCTERRVLGDTGSDHRPVVFDFQR